MAAVAPVTTSSVPPPPAGGTSSSPTPQSASGPPAAAPNQVDTAAIASISNTVKSSPDSAGLGVVNGRLTVVASTPGDAQSVSNAAPSAMQIESALTALQLALDNLPAEHPNAPNVVELQNKESELRQALTQVQIAQVGAGAVYLSGIVLNAAV